jgi:hypothetical protein
MNKHDWGIVNQKYAAIKQEQTDLMAEMKDDLDFYRKRIYQATKELSKGTFEGKQDDIKNAFLSYAQLLIDHFKMSDIKELMSEQLDTILEESDEEEQLDNGGEIKTPDEITKQFLIRGEKPSIIRIEDCFNVIKTSTSDDNGFKPKRTRTPTPSINIRQDKFREKGVKKKPIDDKIKAIDNKNNDFIKNDPIIYDETNPSQQKDTS